jgi:hypothetical protein
LRRRGATHATIRPEDTGGTSARSAFLTPDTGNKGFCDAATYTGAEHFGNVVNRGILKHMAAAIEAVLKSTQYGTSRKCLRTVIHTVPYPGTDPLSEMRTEEGGTGMAV